MLAGTPAEAAQKGFGAFVKGALVLAPLAIGVGILRFMLSKILPAGKPEQARARA